jgi:sugar transferase EpsL
LKNKNVAHRRGTLFLKRIIDIVGGIIVLQLLLGPMVVVAVLIRLKLGKPVFFKQLRPGRYGKCYLLMKFRTMHEAVDEKGHLLPDELRLTTLGNHLRRWSLDELPELWNVIKGEMSLVGPRPLLIEYLPRYSLEQARRHNVKPGITGLAQVNGRNAITWEDRFRLDVWYVDNHAFWLDLKIMAKTAGMILKKEGITQPGQATMEEFKGSSTGQVEISSGGGTGWGQSAA